MLIAIGQEGLHVEGLFVANPMSADRTLGTFPNANEQVTRVLERRTLEPWTGGAERTVTTMREGPAIPDLGSTTTQREIGSPSPSSDSQPPVVLVGRLVSLRFVLGTLRRLRRKIWLSLAALGLVVGLGYHLVVPRSYSAYATLYLAQAPGTDPCTGIANDLALLQTTCGWIQRAADLLGERSLSSAKLLGKAPGTPLRATTCSTLNVAGPTKAEAVRRANALAYSVPRLSAPRNFQEDNDRSCPTIWNKGDHLPGGASLTERQVPRPAADSRCPHVCRRGRAVRSDTSGACQPRAVRPAESAC